MKKFKNLILPEVPITLKTHRQANTAISHSPLYKPAITQRPAVFKQQKETQDKYLTPIFPKSFRSLMLVASPIAKKMKEEKKISPRTKKNHLFTKLVNNNINHRPSPRQTINKIDEIHSINHKIVNGVEFIQSITVSSDHEDTYHQTQFKQQLPDKSQNFNLHFQNNEEIEKQEAEEIKTGINSLKEHLKKKIATIKFSKDKDQQSIQKTIKNFKEQLQHQTNRLIQNCLSKKRISFHSKSELETPPTTHHNSGDASTKQKDHNPNQRYCDNIIHEFSPDQKQNQRQTSNQQTDEIMLSENSRIMSNIDNFDLSEKNEKNRNDRNNRRYEKNQFNNYNDEDNNDDFVLRFKQPETKRNKEVKEQNLRYLQNCEYESNGTPDTPQDYYDSEATINSFRRRFNKHNAQNAITVHEFSLDD